MPDHSTTKITLTCQFCGCTYYKYPSQNPNGRSKYCSRLCANRGIATQQTKHSVACAVCGKPIFARPSELRKYCSPECYHSSRKNIPRKTGNIRVEGGYRLVYMPDHPRSKSNGYVREHILIAERMLGRPLTMKEVVHHIDGNRSNNDPSNLQVLSSQSEHMSLHMTEFHANNPDFRRRKQKKQIS